MALEDEIKEWESKVKKQLEKRPERKEKFENFSQMEVKRLYTPKDIDDFNYSESLGFPGYYPFTRGVQSTMYRGKFWTMRQYAGYATAEESNKRYKTLLDQGQTGLSVAFDLPTQIGYDSDDEISLGEVGKVGVAIDSLQDMETLFGGIPLDKVSTSMTINAPAAILLSMYMVVGEKQGASVDQLRGTIQNDILKEYVARGTYIFPPQPSIKIITDIFEFCSKNVPKWNTISISGYHIREAGSTAVQEIAFTLADGIAYVNAAIKAGLDPNVFGTRLSFFFAAHNDFFEEIAKFRVARRMWARIMKERFKITNEKAMRMRFHTQTGGSTLTAQQPDNNIVRVAIQALAAVLGGTQSLHTNSRDEALGLPTEESVRIALKTQQIIAYESGVTDTVDPMAGSYYLEHLTNEIESKAWDYIKKIDEMGGMVAAIENGWVQKEIHESAYRQQKMVDAGERVIVGVNKFQIEDDHKPEILKVDPLIGEKQVKKLEELKRTRDTTAVKSSLSALSQAAKSGSNIVPYIYESVKNYATLGEITNVLREIYGEYTETIFI